MEKTGGDEARGRSVTIPESRYNTGFAELNDNLRGEAGRRDARQPGL